MNVLLSTTYFGPVQWYQKLYRSDCVVLEACESFVKQTYRNRCVIATANGPLALTVPVEHDRKGGEDASADHIRCLRISNHGAWRRLHWNALQSAYSESPFFEYYCDDLKPFFEQDFEFLYDFNYAIMQKLCELLDIYPTVCHTTEYIKAEALCHQSSLTVSGGSWECLNLVKGHEEAAPLTVSGGSLERDALLAASLVPAASSELLSFASPITDFRTAIRPKHPETDADFVPRPYYQVFAPKHGFLPNLSILDLLFNMGPEGIFWL